MIRKLAISIPLAVIALATVARSQNPASTERIITVEEGLVTLIDEVNVPATQIGMLMEIHVKEGQSIDKDFLLVDIDNRETKAKQRIAEGELNAALKQAENVAEIDLAEKGILVSHQELEAFMEINARTPGAVSETEIRKYKFQLDRAFAQEKVARNENLIAHVTAEVKKAQLDAAGIEMHLRQIRSPFKGQIIEIFKKRGEWVQAGEPIMHVASLDKVRIKGTVPADLASPIEVIGKPVTITVDAAGKRTQTVKGTIGFASPIIDLSGEFRVWVDVDNEKLVDPVTKQEIWKIQPGTMAHLKIDLTPPPPLRPVTSAKSDSKDKGSTAKSQGTSIFGQKTEGQKDTSKKTDSPTRPAGTTPALKASPADGKTTPPAPTSTEAGVQALKPVLTGPAGDKSSDKIKGIMPKTESTKSEPIKAKPSKALENFEKKNETKNVSPTSKER